MADLTRKDMEVFGTRLKKMSEFVKPPLGVMYESRANIGARNPLPVATRKLLMLHQFTPYTGTNLKDMLETAFSELKYEKMFDPRYGSPLYYGLFRATRRLAESSRDPGRYADSLQKIKVEPPSRPGAIPPECQYLAKSANPATTIGGAQLQYRDTTAGMTNNGLEFNDPVQGCLADCWFIAALSAVALAETMTNPATKRIARAPPVYVCPPPTPSWATKQSITSDLSFYTTQNGTKPYYAQLNPNKVKPAFYESWVSYYEKCFAWYYEKNRTPPFPQNNNPNYDSLNYRDTFGALADITGRVASTWVTRDYFGADVTSDNDEGIITKIRATACNNSALDPYGVVLLAKRPAVAHTYYTLDYVPALAQRADYGAAVAYDCAGMPANHAYTILGLYQKDNVQYVVLRNPWGHSGNAADFRAALRSELATSLTTLPAPLSTTNIGAEGIFGLSSVAFMRYFEEFGCTAAL